MKTSLFGSVYYSLQKCKISRLYSLQASRWPKFNREGLHSQSSFSGELICKTFFFVLKHKILSDVLVSSRMMQSDVHKTSIHINNGWLFRSSNQIHGHCVVDGHNGAYEPCKMTLPTPLFKNQNNACRLYEQMVYWSIPIPTEWWQEKLREVKINICRNCNSSCPLPL